MRFWLYALIALLLAACHSGERQHLQLAELERQNRADSLMLNDSLARALADYFDRHGTPNEQMRAYYILGRTYADRGEVPAALDAYNTASDRADTTATDCDYAKLSRVHAQKAELFYAQLLPDNMIREERLAMRYAQLAKDTMTYIYCYGMLAEGFDMKNMPDSSLFFLENAYNQYKKKGCDELAAALCCSIADIYRKNKDYKKAENYIKEYERESHLFDDNGLIESGREIYYSCKGLLCLETNDFHKAEIYFRILLDNALSYNTMMAAFDNLKALYGIKFDKDSLMKYDSLCDSLASVCHIDIEMEKSLQMQAMYDYSRNEKEAHQRNIAYYRILLLLIILAFIFILFLLISSFSYIRFNDTKQQLEKRISLLSQRAINEKLLESPIVRKFKQYLKDYPKSFPSFDDWKQLHRHVISEIPLFQNLFSNKEFELNDFECDICLLIKIQISTSDIARLKQCTPAHITQTRKRIYKKIFKRSGKADELNEYILSLS